MPSFTSRPVPQRRRYSYPEYLRFQVLLHPGSIARESATQIVGSRDALYVFTFASGAEGKCKMQRAFPSLRLAADEDLRGIIERMQVEYSHFQGLALAPRRFYILSAHFGRFHIR